MREREGRRFRLSNMERTTILTFLKELILVHCDHRDNPPTHRLSFKSRKNKNEDEEYYFFVLVIWRDSFPWHLFVITVSPEMSLMIWAISSHYLSLSLFL